MRETQKWRSFFKARATAKSEQHAGVADNAHFFCYQKRDQPGWLLYERYWDAIPAPRRSRKRPAPIRTPPGDIQELLTLLIEQRGASADDLASYLKALHPFRIKSDDASTGDSEGGGGGLDIDAVGVSFSETNGLQFHDSRRLALLLDRESAPPPPATRSPQRLPKEI